ncbi:hypothetical protein D3C87_1836270 [compost metagenome]
MSAYLFTFKINRAGSIIFKHCSCLCTGFANGLFSVVNDHFFSKGIDEMFGAAGNFNPVWEKTGKLYRITDHVTP